MKTYTIEESSQPHPMLRFATSEPRRKIAEAVASALAGTGRVFRRDGVVLEALTDATGRVRLAPLTRGSLGYLLDDLVEFTDPDRGDRRGSCPPAVLGQLLERPDSFLFPSLAGVAHGALLRADGSLVTDHGYDPATGVFLENQGAAVVVSEHPTAENAATAKDFLDELLGEFHFATDADRAGAVAALATLCSRSMVNDHVPVFVVTSAQPGAGKTALLDVFDLVAPSEDDAFAVVRDLRGRVSGSALAVKSKPRTTIRTRKAHEASMGPMLVATGINVVPELDLARRSIVIELQTPPGCAGEIPYAVRNLRAHARERRSELLSAVFTIIRYHIVQGINEIELPAWNSFDSWSRIVRGALVRVGYPDPIATMRAARDHADVTPVLLATLLPWLQSQAPEGRSRLAARRLFEMLQAAEEGTDTATVAELFHRACEMSVDTRKQGLSATSIGVVLGGLRTMEHGGLRLVSTLSHGRHVWSVEVVSADDVVVGGGGPPVIAVTCTPSVLASSVVVPDLEPPAAEDSSDVVARVSGDRAAAGGGVEHGVDCAGTPASTTADAETRDTCAHAGIDCGMSASAAADDAAFIAPKSPESSGGAELSAIGDSRAPAPEFDRAYEAAVPVPRPKGTAAARQTSRTFTRERGTVVSQRGSHDGAPPELMPADW